MCANQVVFELHGQSLTLRDDLGRDFACAWQVCKEEQHAQCIVQVSKRIYESRISFFYDVIQFHLWRKVALEARSVADFIAAKRFADLLCEGFLVAELGEEWFV